MKDYKIDLMEKPNLVSFFLLSGVCSLASGVRYYSAPLCLSAFVAIKLCETNPISKMPKMLVSDVMATTNNKKLRTMNYSKRTQTNPIYGELVEPILTGKVRGVFKEFSCEVEKLSGVSAVGDFVVNGKGHIHKLANCNAAVVRHAGVCYSADAEDTALAGDDYRDKGVYSKGAKVADGNAGAFQVGEQQCSALGFFDNGFCVGGDLP
jgi:hypothetical protein